MMLSSTLNRGRFSFRYMAATLSERIALVIEEQELTQEALADIADCSKGWINQLLSGTGKSLSYDHARNIAARYGYSIEWLIDGKPPKKLERPAAEQSNADADEVPFAGDSIPVVGYVLGGDKGFFDEMGHATGHGEGYVTYPTKDRNTYALRVRGDSMRPRMKPGEFIVVMPNRTVTVGDEVVVRTKDGRVMVKRLALRRAGMVELQSVNESDHAPITLDESEVEKMHYVGGIAKDDLYRMAM